MKTSGQPALPQQETLDMNLLTDPGLQQRALRLQHTLKLLCNQTPPLQLCQDAVDDDSDADLLHDWVNGHIPELTFAQGVDVLEGAMVIAESRYGT